MKSAAVLVHPSKPIVMRFDGEVRSRLAIGLQPTCPGLSASEFGRPH